LKKDKKGEELIVLREPEKCHGVVREDSALPCVKSERTSNNSESFISACTIMCGFLYASILPLVAVSKVKKISYLRPLCRKFQIARVLLIVLSL